MTLNKRYLRNIKNNLSFYICIVILNIIIVVLYVALIGSYYGQRKYLKEFYNDTNVEDAQFVTVAPIDTADIEKLENEYNVELEPQYYADVNLTEADCDERVGSDIAEDYTIRIFKPSEKIDIYKVLDGRDVENDNEILLNPHLMDARKLEIGDSINIDGTDYEIVGTMARPDYLSVYKNMTDNLFLFDAFGYGIITDNAFARLDDDRKIIYYTVRYSEDSKEKEFREKIHEDHYTLSYTAASANVRIKVPLQETDQLSMYINQVMPMMIVFVMIIIAIILGRKIKQESRQIGVLSALGYSRGRLSMYYGMFGVIPGIVGVVLGMIVAVPSRTYLAKMIYESKTEILPVTYDVSIPTYVGILLIPVIAYWLVGVVTAFRVLRFKTVDLLHGNGSRKKHMRMRMAKSGMKFSTKFKIRSILGNWSRSLVVVFGIAVGGIMMVFCDMCITSMNHYCDKSVNEVGSYNYEYFLNSIHTEPVEDGTEIMVGSFSVDGYVTNVIYMGMDDNEYMNLKSTTGEKLTLDSGKHYISAMGAMIYGIKKGDTLDFYDQASLKEYKIVIDDIVKNDSQSIVYGNWKDTCELLGVPEGSYNAVLSDKKLGYKESEYMYKITKEELSDQIGQVVISMKSLMAPCIILAMIIIIICVYLMVNMLVSENATSVSMLKVLGYDNRRINKMVINVYHFLVPVGILLGSVLGAVLCKANFEASTSAYNTYIETVYSPWNFVRYAVVVIVSYVVSLWILGRKVKGVDMVESLKDNRE